MRHPFSSRWRRLGTGGALLVAGITMLFARPDVALAHHGEIYVEGDCYEWETSAVYIGGDGDRKVVVDVWVNDEHIQQAFYFDDSPGGLGHHDWYQLYWRGGSGALETHGTVKTYAKWHPGGPYTRLDHTASVDVTLDEGPCATPTPLPSATPTHTPTATHTAVPTNTPTNTPTATPTTVLQGTITPLPTDTPAPTNTPPPATNTPEPTPSVVSGGTLTPVATATPDSAGTPTPVPTKTNTPVATATPTYISTVEGAVPPEDSGPQSPAAPQPPSEVPGGLPNTGNGASPAEALLTALIGLLLAGAGLAVVATGLRPRSTTR